MSETTTEIPEKTNYWNVIKWATYDLGNTIFSMVVIGIIMNQYFLIIGQREYGLNYGRADLVYNVIIIVIQLFVALLIPIAGAIGDRSGKRKNLILYITTAVLILCAILGVWHDLIFVTIIFFLANIAYQSAMVLYDSMLPSIALPKDIGKAGAIGVGIGYIGTIIGYPIILLLSNQWGEPVSTLTPEITTFQYGYFGRWETFLICAGLFAVLMIPFLFVKEKSITTTKNEKVPIKELLRNSFSQVKSTFKEIRSHREIFKFVIGYFIFSDVMNIFTIKLFLIIRDGLLLETSVGIIMIIISTVSGVLVAYFIGMLADRKGSKFSFILVGILWLLGLIPLFFGIFFWAPIPVGFNFKFILVLLSACFCGIGLSGAVISQRAMIIELSPKDKVGEFFGFSKLNGKSSAIISTLIWALVILIAEPIWGLRSYAWVLVAMAILMAIGFTIIMLVNSKKKIINEEKDTLQDTDVSINEK